VMKIFSLGSLSREIMSGKMRRSSFSLYIPGRKNVDESHWEFALFF
jgi:hypothetical protein